jgi:hypothetical protein
MITRYLIATVGALAITLGLMWLMKDIAVRYVTRDPIRYFQIHDFIPAPDRGRERPQPPPDPRLAPGVPELEHDPLRERAPTAPDPALDVDPEILREPVDPDPA